MKMRDVFLLLPTFMAVGACASPMADAPSKRTLDVTRPSAQTEGSDANHGRRVLTQGEAIALAEKYVSDHRLTEPKGSFEGEPLGFEIEPNAWGILHEDGVWSVIFRFARRNFQFNVRHLAPDGGTELDPEATTEHDGVVVIVNTNTGQVFKPHLNGLLAAFERLHPDGGK